MPRPKGFHHSEETKKNISQANKGHIVSDETKQKISQANKGMIGPNRGKRLSEETKKKLSIIGTGRHLSEEIKRKMSQSQIGHKTSNETKKKMSEIAKRENLSDQTRKKMREKRLLQKHTWTTSIEIKIRDFLTTLNIEFISHKPIINISLPCQCDIYIPQYNLIIECDGNYWHHYPDGREIDHIRTKELIEKGYKVLRLWESEIRVMNVDTFKQRLEAAV